MTPEFALQAIGWPLDDDGQPAVAEWREALLQHPDARPVRVIEQHRSGYVVADGPDTGFTVESLPEWQRPPSYKKGGVPPEQRAAVGDWVLIEPATGKDQIVALLPRRSAIKRGAAGEHYRQQLIAANVDHVLVVSGLDDDFNPRRIERYLLVIQSSGASPVLVLTKADKTTDFGPALDTLAHLSERGIPVHALNAKDPAQVAVLHPYLGPGKTAVLVGSSGAGKSTLTNTLLGIEKQKTNTVRENDSRGRHTTTNRVLLPLPQGGCLIDTPGMRELKLSGEEDLADGGFEDVEALSSGCRFSDCGHSNEPGCAVRAAIEDGTLTEARYAHYCKLRDERDAAAVSLADRRAEEREANRLLAKRTKDKYGRR